MIQDFMIISELKSLREQQSKLSQKELELSLPIVADFDRIPQIYEWFCQLQADKPCPGRNGSVHQRKQFLFIILFLCSPVVLAGGRMPFGLRDAIAHAIGLKDITFISHNIETVVFMHQNYRCFREEVEPVYTEILRRLRDEGMLEGE